MWPPLQMAQHKTSKIGMETLITADEFIAEGEAWHQPSFLEPEDGAEAATEKNTFYCCKCYQSFGKAAVINPAKRPFCFFLYSRYGIYGMKQPVFF